MSTIFRYTNPITSDPAMSMRDHQILKVGAVWYMTGTAPPYWKGESPGVRLFRSDNLLNWIFVDWLIDASTLPAACFYKGRFWAPEIHPAHGRFYLTVNCGHGGGPEDENRMMLDHAIILLVADRIEGPYELITRDKPLGQPFKNDASLFTDDDGRTYMYCSGGGLWQAEIDLPAGKLIGHNNFQKFCSPGDMGSPHWMMGGIEGPFVIKRDGFYYLFFSAWTRGYEVGVMRSENPLGPWKLTPPDPIFGTRKRRHRLEQAEKDGYAHLPFEDTPDPYAEAGHCSIFEGPDGKDWLSCHYLKEGQKPIRGHSLEYADSVPQLGIEPLRYREGYFLPICPTWTEQTVVF